MANLKVTCQGATTVKYTQIEDFQGGLKTITPEDLAALKTQMTTHGFNSPIHVWKGGSKYYTLDGHQRVAALKALEEDGWGIPPVPVDLIKARNKAEAKRILLSRVAQYGKLNPGGLYEYMADSEIALDEVKDNYRLPDLDVEKLEEQFFGKPKVDPEGSKEVDKETYTNLVHQCPKCKFRFGKGAPTNGE